MPIGSLNQSIPERSGKIEAGKNQGYLQVGTCIAWQNATYE
jgi:hypothetical protein